MQPQVIAGWRVLVKVNNENFAAGSVLDYSIGTSAYEINTVDLVIPFELAPQRITVDMTLRVFRTPENDPAALGISPQGQSGNVQDYFTRSEYITVEVRDKITDQIVIALPKAWIVRRTGGGEAEGLFMETWNIRSIGYQGPEAAGKSLLPSLF